MFRPSVALIALVLPLTVAHSREPQLPPTVTRALERFSVPVSHVSMYVRDAGTNEVVLSVGADEPRSPASTIKVLTTFTALDVLGPGYTWKTRALIDGELANGVLRGDLVLAGGGDPYMTSERWWSFVQNLRERGLAKITGDIVIDNTYFAPAADNPADFDGQGFRSYNVLPDALLVNFQTTRFTIAATPRRAQPQVILNPAPANLRIDNRLHLGAGKCAGYNRGVSFDSPEAGDRTTVTLTGTFPAACGSFSINRAVMSAPDFAYGTFRTLWTQSGGALDGAYRAAAAPATAAVLYEHESLPLPEIIRLINKYSNNVMARHLLLTLGAEQFGPPATPEKGRNAVRAWLARRGIDASGVDPGEWIGLVARRTHYRPRARRDARRRLA